MSVIFISATAFRNAKALEQAKEAYVKAADLQKCLNAYPFLAMIQLIDN